MHLQHLQEIVDIMLVVAEVVLNLAADLVDLVDLVEEQMELQVVADLEILTLEAVAADLDKVLMVVMAHQE
tara:strand:+ start:224 stop:436 length:213 start_codon:yes stop_codon:yes gene_type:complete